MKLGEAKEAVYKLLDEYSANGEMMLDEDIVLRMNTLFDIAQKNMAALCPVRKLIEKTDSCDTDGKIIKVLGVYNLNGNRVEVKKIGNKYMFDGRALVDVLTMPEDITKDTPDDYEFEIKEAFAAAMPFWVAAQINVTDLVVGANGLLAAYDRTVQMAMSSTSPYTGTAEVV